MVEGGGGPDFPVILYDGEKEMNIGNVKINPTMEYKPFQLMLSQKIGISPNHISIYLVDRKKSLKSPFMDKRRRIPITGKVNFGLICRQKDCCFLVVLKRSRKSRNRRERTINGAFEFADYLPENLILLRRDQAMPFYDQIMQSELVDLNDRLQRSRIDVENYNQILAMSNEIGIDFNRYLRMNSFPTVATTKTTMMMMTKNEEKKVFCEECLNEKKDGSTASFHPCANDAIITGFRSLVGPIDRPNQQLNSLTDLGFSSEEIVLY